MTYGEEILVCPECDRGGLSVIHNSDLPRYRCKKCNARFEEPNRRESRSHGQPTSKHAKALFDANADDIVTDGGVPSTHIEEHEVTKTTFTCASCGDRYVFTELGDWPVYCPTCGHDHSETAEEHTPQTDESAAAAAATTQEQIEADVHPRVVDAVEEWDGVGARMGETLSERGYETVAELADAETAALEDIQHVGPTRAEAMVEQATAMLEANQTAADTAGGETQPVETDGSGATETEAVDVDVSTRTEPQSPDAVVAKHLPDGTTRDDVRDLAEEERYLGEVADALGIETAAARTLLHRLDCYELVREGASYRGGAD